MWTAEEGRLRFRATIPHDGRAMIEVKIAPDAPVRPMEQNATYRFRVAVRRYLSEFRDNYVDRYLLRDWTMKRQPAPARHM